jgi:signal transduction histidine kinase
LAPRTIAGTGNPRLVRRIHRVDRRDASNDGRFAHRPACLDPCGRVYGLSCASAGLRRVRDFVGDDVARQSRAKHVDLPLTHDESRVAMVVADDGIGFDVARVLGQMGLTEGVGLLEQSRPFLHSQIGQAKELSSRLLAETRRLILGLRPTVLDDMGLLPAIRWYAESYLGDRGIAITGEAEMPAQRLPTRIEVPSSGSSYGETNTAPVMPASA